MSILINQPPQKVTSQQRENKHVCSAKAHFKTPLKTSQGKNKTLVFPGPFLLEIPTRNRQVKWPRGK